MLSSVFGYFFQIGERWYRRRLVETVTFAPFPSRNSRRFLCGLDIGDRDRGKLMGLDVFCFNFFCKFGSLRFLKLFQVFFLKFAHIRGFDFPECGGRCLR